MTGSTWRNTVSTGRSCCSMEVYWVSSPFQSWGQNSEDILFFCCLCHSAQPIPSGVTDTSHSNGSPVWEMPTALICLTSTFAFLELACCSDTQSHTCPLFIRKYKEWRHCARWGIKIFPNPQIPTEVCSFFMSLGVG